MTSDYSLEALKAMRASEMKRRSFWPRLAREGNKLILSHPHRGGHKARRDLAAYVEKNLPEFRWNSKECRWEAPLSDDLLAKTLDAFVQAREVQLRLSDGVRQLIEEKEEEGAALPDTITLVVQYEASSAGRYLRSKGRVVGVQRNGDEPRPPKNHISPDDAGRYLEARGYQFVEAESTWLDRPGTSFQPKRQQVFRKVTA